MNYRGIYEDIRNCLKKSITLKMIGDLDDYEFALYDKDEELIVFKEYESRYDERFTGCTIIDYEGKNIAIWDMGTSKDDDILELSKNISHEIYHMYQNKFGEERHADELYLVDYPYSKLNLTLKFEEALLISSILKYTDEECLYAQEIFKILERNRLKRREMFPEAVEYEYSIETIEGMAEWFSLEVLKDLDEFRYNEKIEIYKQYIMDYNNMFNMKRYSYYFGALIITALKKYGLFNHNNTFNKTSYVTEFQTKGKGFAELLEKMIKEEQAENKVIIDSILKKYTKRKEGDFKLSSFDPQNVTKVGDYVLHKSFCNISGEVINKSVLTRIKDNICDIKEYFY